MKSDIEQYKQHLIKEEKSPATVEKYVRDVSLFTAWLRERELDKGVTLEYKEYLTSRYAPRSVNAAISSLNSFFDYLGRADLKIQTIKIQRQIFARKDKELTRVEYDRLLRAAKERSERLYYLMQTICVTGIRVSEDIYCKG